MRALAAAIFSVLFLALPATAGAQVNYRSYVSFGGSDTNDCSRSSPCSSWQRAVNETLSGGEVVALDSAEYSAVVVDRSVILDGGGARASILANGADAAIYVNNPAAKVVIRRLFLNGQGELPSVNQPGAAGPFGISVDAARAVRVEDVRISDFTRVGIRIAPDKPSSTTIVDSLVADNGTHGINIFSPTGDGANRVTLRNVTLTDNAQNGIGTTTRGTGRVVVNVFNSLVGDNGLDGIRSQGANAKVRISNTGIVGNVGQGLHSLDGGQILSWGNNEIAGNTVDGAPTGMLSQH